MKKKFSTLIKTLYFVRQGCTLYHLEMHASKKTKEMQVFSAIDSTLLRVRSLGF